MLIVDASLTDGHVQAALKNPHVSEEAKEHSREMIDELSAQGEPTAETLDTELDELADEPGKREGGDTLHETRVNAGYKAALKSESRPSLRVGDGGNDAYALRPERRHRREDTRARGARGSRCDLKGV